LLFDVFVIIVGDAHCGVPRTGTVACPYI